MSTQHTSPGWECIYCHQMLAHTISAAEHFDNCPELKKKLEMAEKEV
jgi:hypothetical protein